MPLPDCRWLVLERTGFALSITLNRPMARNAMSAAMAEELSAVFASVRDDRSVGAIVIKGAGPHFCAGGDLKDMTDALAPPGAGEQDRLFAVNRRFGDLLMQVDAQPQAVTVSLNSDFLGAGRVGDWIEGSATITRTTRELIFARAELGSARHPILSVSGVWKIVAKRHV